MARLPHLVLVLATASVLAACGSSDNVAPPPAAPPPPVVVKQEDQFGAAFASAFRADPNSEPVTPMNGDIIAPSLTAEPVNLG